jgi:APA family basic amino acid/polyamine antiporter
VRTTDSSAFLARTGKIPAPRFLYTDIVLRRVFAAIPLLTDILINFGALCNVIVVAIVCVTVLVAAGNFPNDLKAVSGPPRKALPM